MLIWHQEKAIKYVKIVENQRFNLLVQIILNYFPRSTFLMLQLPLILLVNFISLFLIIIWLINPQFLLNHYPFMIQFIIPLHYYYFLFPVNYLINFHFGILFITYFHFERTLGLHQVYLLEFCSSQLLNLFKKYF